MAVQIRCPVCSEGVVVKNANYLVVLNCHTCGCEFLADAKELSTGKWVPDVAERDESWGEEKENREHNTWGLGDDNPAVLMFCPMCGELASESSPTCGACGEPLPVDGPRSDRGWESTSRQARRFRWHARLLGGLWLVLAYALSSQDFWVGGTKLTLPPMLFGGDFSVPPLPLMTSILIFLGAFAFVGQFWAVAAGGLFNYLVLFLVVWQVNFLSLGLITVSIVFTHYTLHQASIARFH